MNSEAESESDEDGDDDDDDTHEQDRIVNGYSVEKKEYYVAIQEHGNVYCGGALISPEICSVRRPLLARTGQMKYCREELVDSKIRASVVLGVERLDQLQKGRNYEIESVRQPSERIE